MTTLQQFQEPGTLSYFNITTPGTKLKWQRNAILLTEIPFVFSWIWLTHELPIQPSQLLASLQASPKTCPKNSIPDLQFGSSGPKWVIQYICVLLYFCPIFLSMVDTEPCSSASRLPGIGFPKVTPEIICETGPDFINDLAKKTKHVRISFQWPGGLEYRIWMVARIGESRRSGRNVVAPLPELKQI